MHVLSLLSDFWAHYQTDQQTCQVSAPETTYCGFVLVLRLKKSDLFSRVRLVSVCSSLPLMFFSTSSNKDARLFQRCRLTQSQLPT